MAKLVQTTDFYDNTFISSQKQSKNLCQHPTFIYGVFLKDQIYFKETKSGNPTFILQHFKSFFSWGIERRKS